METYIEINPNFDPFWHSLYFKGLLQLAPSKNISFTIKGFPEYIHKAMMFRILHNGRWWKIVLDAEDKLWINPLGYDWCDVYGKFNIGLDSLESKQEKIIPIGPIFPIQALSRSWAFYYWLKSLLILNFKPNNFKDFFANFVYRPYKYSFPEKAYTPQLSRPDYVFMSSQLWRKDQETNELRAMFMRECREMSWVQFEGGFHPRAGNFEQYKDLFLKKMYPFHEYIQNLRNSAFVLYNHSVAGSHSWRLGEYLALGKAIISLPIERKIPAPLIHGTHIHFVEPAKEAIEKAIQLLLSNNLYRQNLEINARKYYLQNATPEKSIERLLATCK